MTDLPKVACDLTELVDQLDRLAEKAKVDFEFSRPGMKLGDDAVIGAWFLALADAWPTLRDRLRAAEAVCELTAELDPDDMLDDLILDIQLAYQAWRAAKGGKG